VELQPGRMLAHYRLVEKIGEGGMGVVWKADDTKLGRQVAIKVLPEVFAQDADRMARFAREAQVLASLNHPHVAAIYGLEEQGPVRGLVLELIDGETLAERIAAGPVPVDEALRVGSQIAEAMEAAHATGTIHRDLKPGNVKITAKGSVKVLDFGLAKALAAEPATAQSSTLSPTITASPTLAGVILGTASYMSPEQARGKPADRRSDVWSFGVILFEMLTGNRLFSGETVTDVLAAVVRAEPAWEQLPVDTPQVLRRLLRRCLAKDPERRLRDFGDVFLELREAREAPQGEAAIVVPRSVPRRVAGPAGALLLAAAAAVGGWMLGRSPGEEPVIVSSILPPAETEFHLDPDRPGSPVLSPDGRMLAFTARNEQGDRVLYVRPLDSREAYVLTGTESAHYPFWSPDSRYLGFFSWPPGKLKKVPVSGGTPVTLCDAENPKGGAWGLDGAIVFAPEPDAPLYKVRDTGGIATPLTRLDAERGELSHRHPFFLPGGDQVLFLIAGGADSIAAVGIRDGAVTRILDSPVGASYASGHLLFVQDGRLLAQSFDPDRLALSGEPTPLAEHVGLVTSTKAVFSVSSTGRLAFMREVPQPAGVLKRVDPNGRKSETLGEPAAMSELAISPDGSRAALVIRNPQTSFSDIWIQDLIGSGRTRFTFEPGNEFGPVWSPDGDRIFYVSIGDGPNKILVKAANGSGEAKVAVEWKSPLDPESVSPDGRWIIGHPWNPSDLWALPLHEGDEPYRLVDGSRFSAAKGHVSPDGHWMVYMSVESGRPEIYVTSFPKAKDKWQVSSAGGTKPLWSHDGRKVVYLDRAGMIVEVPVVIRDGVPSTGTPVTRLQSWSTDYDYRYGILPDGRFLLLEDTSEVERSPVTLIQNWPRMLEENGSGS
jgi:serine/threonine protein kinase